MALRWTAAGLLEAQKTFRRLKAYRQLPILRNVLQEHKTVYRQRNIIERMFCRLKDWRRIATRFDRNIKNFIAAIALAAAVIWWL